jgi:hypothetical protein
MTLAPSSSRIDATVLLPDPIPPASPIVGFPAITMRSKLHPSGVSLPNDDTFRPTGPTNTYRP